MDVSQFELDALAVFSHPDDAELSVSGTLLRLKALGYRTGVLDMTRGEMGTRGTPELRAEESNLDSPAAHGLFQTPRGIGRTADSRNRGNACLRLQQC